VSVFETDEFDHLMAVRTALAHHTLALEWSIYGHLFFNLALVPLSVLNAFYPVTDTTIIVALRLVSLSAAASAVLLTFALASRHWGSAVGWFALVGLAVLPSSFNYWAVTSHPDSLQVACTMVSLYAACRFTERGQDTWFDAAAAGAGLAFAAKYGGLFLLPGLFVLAALVRPGASAADGTCRTISRIQAAVLLTGLVGLVVSLSLRAAYTGPRWFPVQDIQLAACVLLVGIGMFDKIWKGLSRSWRPRVFVARALRAASIFWIAFIVVSPFSVNRLTFVSGVLFESRIAAFGQFFAAGGNRLDWFAILASPACVGVVCMGLAGFGLYQFMMRLAREGRLVLASPDGVLWTWIIGFTLFLILRVHLRENRYLLVIVPPLLILAGDSLLRILDALSQRRQSRFLFTVGVSMAIVWAAVELSLGTERQLALVRERQSREQTSDAVQAGLWLQSHMSPAARVLYDWYSYVPPMFTAAQGSWGMTSADLSTFNPDVIVVNDAIRARFSSINDASRYYDKAAFLDRHHFYESLEKGQAGFVLVKSVGPIRLYETTPVVFR
jgi:hypothetical protein